MLSLLRTESLRVKIAEIIHQNRREIIDIVVEYITSLELRFYLSLSLLLFISLFLDLGDKSFSLYFCALFNPFIYVLMAFITETIRLDNRSAYLLKMISCLIEKSKSLDNIYYFIASFLFTQSSFLSKDFQDGFRCRNIDI